MLGKCIFITGGVRSGKSAFAENFVRQLTNRAAYVATSEAFDEEMKTRIARHQQDRHQQNDIQWTLYEMPKELTHAFDEPVILFECVTTWLTNAMFIHQLDEPVEHFKQWLMELLHTNKTIIIVSNELLDSGLTPYNETNQYLQNIGQLHTWLVTQSSEAYELTNKIVTKWK